MKAFYELSGVSINDPNTIPAGHSYYECDSVACVVRVKEGPTPLPTGVSTSGIGVLKELSTEVHQGVWTMPTSSPYLLSASSGTGVVSVTGVGSSSTWVSDSSSLPSISIPPPNTVLICPTYSTGTITQQEKKMTETYAWSGLNFVLFCIGIAILVGVAILAVEQASNVILKRREAKHERKMDLLRAQQSTPKRAKTDEV